jgi:hypothetical protein
MHDEEEHIDFLEIQIELVARIGLELYAQRHIGEFDEDLSVHARQTGWSPANWSAAGTRHCRLSQSLKERSPP